MEEKKYKIPVSRVVLSFVFAVGGIGALVWLFLWLMDEYSFLTVPLVLVIGLIFFTMNSWAPAMVFPVRSWILDNIKCPVCQGRFGKCFRPKAYGLSDSDAIDFNADDHYLLFCPRCDKNYMVGNSGFSNELKFDNSENSRKVISHYEKNKIHRIYG